MSTSIARREPGILDANTDAGWNLVARKAASIAKSSVIPSDYRGKPENVLIAMEMAQRTDIPVLAVMQQLHVINGRPAWSAQFLITSVNRSGRFSPLRFRFEGEPGSDEWGCRAVATDLGDGEELIGTLITIAMAKAEGWYQKSGSKWKTMPEQMLRYRAASFWARVYSPELSVGTHTADEAEDMPAPQYLRKQEIAAQLDRTDSDAPEVVEGEIIEDEAELVATATGEIPGLGLEG